MTPTMVSRRCISEMLRLIPIECSLENLLSRIGVSVASEYLGNIPESINAERLRKKLKTFFDANDQTYPDAQTEYDHLQKNRVSQICIDRAVKDGALVKPIAWYNPYVFHMQEADSLLAKAKHVVNTLYAINLVKKGQYDNDTARQLKMALVAMKHIKQKYFNDVKRQTGVDVKELYDAGTRFQLEQFKMNHHSDIRFSTVFGNTMRDITRTLAKDEIVLTNEEEEELKAFVITITDHLQNKDNDLYNQLFFLDTNKKNEIKKHKTYLLYMLSYHVAKHTHGFKERSADYRDFTPITKVMKPLRGYTPYQMIEIDIKCAYPSFIDKKFNVSIGSTIYEKIMAEKGISYKEAKIEFNKLLNNHYNLKSYTKKQLMKYGYPDAVATKLAEIITRSKGSFYKMMTRIEFDVVYDYAFENDVEHWHRVHDAIITYAFPRYKTLPKEMNGYNFDIKDL